MHLAREKASRRDEPPLHGKRKQLMPYRYTADDNQRQASCMPHAALNARRLVR